ncbi:alpha/beta hydrolase [Mangrovibacterium diazotrophicum]|uniref:Alpha/beta superfamily hydrolase n=1 Tax=Mangrovibacterium diazotrophicum TaxID=1261403 RepID=A0A419W6K9_9BACT|nr:alpha/beta hydrolase-fold protein [Mangrovibacterium diazotrophicum]RKD91012.1 hypothetical protein BC643_1361 [Mangrovibacterium diazotrophicum]
MKQRTAFSRYKYRIIHTFLLLFIWSSQQTAFAVSEGIHKTVFSPEINDSIRIDIQLPDSYERFPDQNYPVMYLLDGDFYFDYAAATSQMLSRGIQPFTPQFILVGISTNDRFRDFTPTNAKLNNDDTPVPPNYHVSGGADRFTQFLTTTLKPQIEANYRTNGFNMLFGHSFGGLYAMDLLLHQKAEFNAWLIADPSLWWDKEHLFRDREDLLKRTFKPTTVYIGYTNSISIPPGIDTTLMADCNRTMTEQLQATMKNFHLQTRFYPECSHGSVVIPTFYDGLCFFFEGYSINPKLEGFNLAMLLKTYQTISERIHFKLVPQQDQLETLVRFFMRTPQTRAQAKEFLNFWQEQYPQSNAWVKYSQKLSN